MSELKAKLYKYHKLMGLIFALPLIFCAITGMGIAISDEYLHNEQLGEFFIQLHTLEIIHLEKIYPFILGLSLLGLIFTGLVMSNFTKATKKIK